MTNKTSKEYRDEINRVVYGKKTLKKLKEIGKNKKGLLNVFQYKKADKNILIERIIEGGQLSDKKKGVLLEKAKDEGLIVNSSMSKKVILEKIENPKLEDLNIKRLKEIADKKGISTRTQSTRKEIIQRLENPKKYYIREKLMRIAKDNNIDVNPKITKPNLINILAERNLITTTPLTDQESNLVVLAKDIPEELERVVKKKARNVAEELEDFKKYIKNINKNYITPARFNKLSKQLEKKIQKVVEEHKRIFTPIKEASAFRNFIYQYVIKGVRFYSPMEFLEYAGPAIKNILDSNRKIKVKLYLYCVMCRKYGEGVGEIATSRFGFHSIGDKIIKEDTNISDIYKEMCDEIEEEIRKVQEAEGSGWQFLEIENLKLYSAKWVPAKAGSYIDLPPYLKNKQAIINMKNKDNKCFKWCVLRALNLKDRDNERIDNNLKSKQDTINMKGIGYPVDFRGIDRFESQNPDISITILGYNEIDRVYPLKNSKYTERKNNIVLLLIKDGENSHYCYVKNLSALMTSQINTYKNTRHFCLNSFNSFKTIDSLNNHKEYCYNNECVKIEMPPPDTYLKFKNFANSEKAPFAIYADFESLIKPLDSCDPDPNKSYTKKYQKHEPISFSYYIKSFNENVYESRIKGYIQEKPEDPDAMDIFIEWLEEDVKAIANMEPKPMIFTDEDIKQFIEASNCWICGEKLENDRVRDHCHYTGKYRGATHNSCNLKYRKPKNISVFFHNLTGYDSHLFIKKLGSSDKKETIDCIPKNQEQYISFSKNIVTGQYTNKKGEIKDKTFKIIFKDSLKFMSSSLEALVNNLPKDAFKNLLKFYTPEQAELLKQKGFYPYEYMDSVEKLKDKKLPPQKAFYSKLTGKGISNKNYKHACNVWDSFNMETMKDYHELYNDSDALLLADVFENFRDLCLKIYRLDPVYYFTAPGLAWDACLKMTSINLELLSNPDMLLMFEKGIRGGVSIIRKRYGEANNKYMRSFNKNKPSKYLIDLDANNLYGDAMSRKLPTHGFKW